VAQRFSVTTSKHAGRLYGERAARVRDEAERAVTEYVERINAEYAQYGVGGMRLCAVILTEDGMPYDGAFNWESAQSYALSQGMRVRALTGDGHMSREDIQALCDAERERYRDCFGTES
jgi:hypothetical protein